ncbi:MAG: GldG family protein [Verrucomicrobiota bacterium]
MASSPKSQPSFSAASRVKIAFDVALRTALVLAVVVMVNILAAKFFHRLYLSPQTRMALSSRTLNVLHSLTNHVSVTLYYDRKDDFYPDIAALLNEYRAANKNISVRTVDYVRDAGEAEKAKAQYRLSAASDKNLVIFDCDQRIKTIPGDALTQFTLERIAPEKPDQKELEFRRKPVAFNGEQAFTAMLLALQNPQPLKAYFLQGHGEGSLADKGNFGFLKLGALLAQNYIKVTSLELTGDDGVPPDCNLLIIAAPGTPLPAAELQKIENYLAEGGRLLALFNFASVERPTGLEPILQHWGINVAADFIKDRTHTITGDDLAVRKFSQHPVVNPLTQLSLQMIRPRPVTKISLPSQPANRPQVEELAFSSESSTLASNPAERPQSYPLIAAAEQKPVAGVIRPRGNTRILVAGDSVFLGNYYIEGGGNRDFVSYAANWLLDRPQLLEGIGPRPVTEFRLLLSRQQQQQLRWLLLGALPGGVLFFGWLVWLVRRK